MKRFTICLVGALLLTSLFSSISSAGDPQYGGTVIVASRSDVSTLNPVWKYDGTAYFISQNIYSTLISMDHGRKAYGDLASSWDVSDDALTYTFHLRDNVFWHDGVKFSSADVKFTYETCIEKKYPISKYLSIVKEILAPDDNTIIFKLSEFNAAFIPAFAQASNWYGQIIAKHLYEGTDIPNNPYNKKPVGTGPFKFVEWKPGQFITVKANENWFHPKPYLDKIV